MMFCEHTPFLVVKAITLDSWRQHERECTTWRLIILQLFTAEFALGCWVIVTAMH